MRKLSAYNISDTEDAVLKFSRLVFGLALSNTGSKADAEDVFQETFLAYHRCNKAFNDEEHKKAWLIKTTINMSRRVTSSSWKKKRASLEYEPESGGDFTLRTEEQTIIHEAVAKLPEKYRVPVWLFYFEEMPTKSIGKALGVSDNTIRSRLSRGREMLRKSLGDYYGKEAHAL